MHYVKNISVWEVPDWSQRRSVPAHFPAQQVFSMAALISMPGGKWCLRRGIESGQ